MKRTALYLAVAVVSVATAFLSRAQAQQAYDGEADISRLLSTASAHFDTSKEDAITLWDGKTVTWSRDGRLSVFVHRILWINSSLTIDEYGDIRVPFDEGRCTFTPLAVRTWRDGKWWPSDSTGIVETLPFALDHAYDYSNMREMMLLLNGVEVPCVVEIAYRIEDKAPYRKGAEGLWLFQGEEPTVESRFELVMPSGQQAQVAASADVPTPQRSSDAGSGLETRCWQMGPLPALPRPHIVDPAADVPHLAWSTWGSWRELGSSVLSGFRPDSLEDHDLGEALDSLLRKGRTDNERASLIAGYVSDRVSYVDYPESYWWTSPRSAERVYSTAYGHRLDRAILASQLLTRAGLTARPVFVSEGTTPLDSLVPSLSRFKGVALHVQGHNLDAIYWADGGDLADFATASGGRTVWSPGLDAAPHIEPVGQGNMDIEITLTYDKDKAKFVGSGFLAADSGLCPIGQLTGLKGEMKAYLNSLMGDLLKGAAVTEYNPERLSASAVVVGFSFEMPKPDPDDQNRTVLALGKPRGGVIDHLPDDVQLCRKDRQSVIHLPFLMSQRVELKLDLGPNRVVYSPATEKIENTAGRFSITSQVEDSQLVVVRELSLAKTGYQPPGWPDLRTLLLAERHDKNALVILSAATEEAKRK